MIGDDFFYDGQWLSSFNMKMCDPGEEQAFVEQEADRSEITSVRSTPNHYSAHYSGVLTFDMLIMKDECMFPGQAEKVLSGDDVGELRAWLESSKTPTEFIAPNADDDDNTHYFGFFTSVQPYVLDTVCYGLKLTFTCDSPYGYSDVFHKTFTINGSIGDVTGKYYNKSAEKKAYLKPIVTIESSSVFGSSESVEITNESDNGNSMSISLPRGLKKLIIDCHKKSIVDEDGNAISLSDIGVTTPISSQYNFISAEQYMFYWLRMVSGENIFTITPSLNNTIKTVDISGRYIIKSGGF